MSKHIIILLVLSFGNHLLAQKIITGKVADAGSSPLSYVNIGILNSPVGTLSNEDGSFSISIPSGLYRDTLTFSAIGFAKKSILVSSLKESNDTTILLTEKITTLRTISVFGKKGKKETYWLGNRFTKGGFLYADSVSAGAAMALLIENKYPAHHAELVYPVYVEAVNIFIDKNSIEDFKIRVRIAERDSTSNSPGRDLLAESIVVISSLKKGWLKVDLSPYRILIDRSFFLVVEWIMTDTDRFALVNQYAEFRKNNPDRVTSDSTIVDGKKIGFWNYLGFAPGTHFGVSAIPFSLENYTCYYRTNSLGEWKRAPVILCARVALTNLLSGESKSDD